MEIDVNNISFEIKVWADSYYVFHTHGTVVCTGKIEKI